MAFGKHSKGTKHVGSHFADSGSRRIRQVPEVGQGSGGVRSPVGPDPLESDAPRPIGVDPEATGSFEKLDAGEGAILTTRNNAEDAADAARAHLSGTTGMMRLNASDLPEVGSHGQTTGVRHNRKMVVLLVVLTAAVILGGAYLFSRLLAVPQQEEEQQVVEQTQTDVASSIEYRGVTYYLEQADGGTWRLMRQSEDEGAEAQSLGDLPGTPVTIVLYDAAIIIPENKSDGTWDVMSYVLGSGWGQLVDSDGAAYAGQGSISSASLEGSDLSIQTDTGSVTVPLDW